MFFVGRGVFYLLIIYDLGSPLQSFVLWWELKHRVPLCYYLGRYSAVFSLLDKLPALFDLRSLSKKDSMWKSLLWSRPIEDSSECVFLITLHNSTFCLNQEYSRNYRNVICLGYNHYIRELCFAWLQWKEKNTGQKLLHISECAVQSVNSPNIALALIHIHDLGQ